MKRKGFKKMFEDLLNSTKLSSNSTQEEYNKVWNVMNGTICPNIPALLYRFRRCTIRNVISFEQQKITTCVADTFSDKYDSNIFVDKSLVEDTVKKFFNQGIIKALYDSKEDESIYSLIELFFGKKLTENVRKKNSETPQEQKMKILDYSFGENVINRIKEMVDTQIDFIRKDTFTKVACFTETIQSKSMWDLYADGYSGFVLGYDFRKLHEKECSTCPKMDCKNEDRVYAKIFPVIYTDKRYDATDVVYNLVQRKVFSELGVGENFLPPIDQLFWFKSYLFKEKKEYQREKEWRLICRCPNKMNEDYSDVPDLNCLKSIYYGPYIDKYNKKHLRDIAKVRKIKEFDVCIDENSQEYKLKIIPL